MPVIDTYHIFSCLDITIFSKEICFHKQIVDTTYRFQHLVSWRDSAEMAAAVACWNNYRCDNYPNVSIFCNGLTAGPAASSRCCRTFWKLQHPHQSHASVSQLLTLLVQVSHSNNVKEVTPDILQMSTSSNYPLLWSMHSILSATLPPMQLRKRRNLYTVPIYRTGNISMTFGFSI